MPKLIGAGASYDSLVANLAGGSDPSRGINPVKLRIKFRQQQIREIPFSGLGAPLDAGVGVSQPNRGPGATNYVGLVSYPTASPLPVDATGTVLVADNDFTAKATLIIGSYKLVSGEDFVVGGGAAATATDLEAAINAIPGFSAVAAGATLTVTGPKGLAGTRAVLGAQYNGSVTNFTLTPDTGFFGGAEPVIGPPEITT